MTVNIKTYSSPADYLSYLKSAPIFPDWGHSVDSDNSDPWCGGSMSQAYQYAEHGWKEGLALLQSDIEVNKRQGRGKGRANDVTGDFPIVARAIAGLPDSMSRRVISEASRKPIVDIYISPMMTSTGNADKFIKLGAAMVDFIDAVEMSGYSVCLTVSMITQNGAHKCGSIFPIKRAGEVMSLEDIVYYIAHPTFLRRLSFKDFAAKLPLAELGYGKGRPISAEDHSKLAESGAIMILPSASIVNGINSVNDAKAWVLKTVIAQRPDLIESLAA